MKQREGFKRVTIEDMKALQAEKAITEAVETAKSDIDAVINEEVEKLAQQLVNEGYEVDSFEITVEHSWEGKTLKVHLSVTQERKVIVFDLNENIS